MSVADGLRSLVNSPAFKFVLVIFLTLALMIPLLFVGLLVSERQGYARTARSEVGNMWGGAQTVRGPYVVVPTSQLREVRTKDGTEQQTIRQFAVFLPEILNIEGNVKTETRKRGIFEVPVYRSEIKFDGRFIEPVTQGFDKDGTTLHWDEAVLVLTVVDVRGIKKTAELSLGNGQAPIKFRAGVGPGANADVQGIHSPISAEQARSGFAFAFTLELNGSNRLRFVPAGGETTVTVKSPWPHPSFAGAFLPDRWSITDAGFKATWTVPRLARGQGQSLKLSRITHLMSSKAFGVNFYQPVGFYSLAERALKYSVGFIGIIFLAVFVMEMQARTRVHWIQYLFVGLALVIFYLVLISTAEHIGFDTGYLLAAVATSTLVGTYFGTVVRSLRRGLVLAAILAVIYALLYLLLRIEDYALLIGSIAAFALLAVVMFATRDVDWSRGAGNAPRPARD